MLNMQFKKVYVSANADIDKEGIIYDHSEKGIFLYQFREDAQCTPEEKGC